MTFLATWIGIEIIIISEVSQTEKDKYMLSLMWNVKNNEILPFATTWMNLEGIMLSEVSQTEKDKYCMLSLICGIQRK